MGWSGVSVIPNRSITSRYPDNWHPLCRTNPTPSNTRSVARTSTILTHPRFSVKTKVSGCKQAGWAARNGISRLFHASTALFIAVSFTPLPM
jgi:hypothetical protein